MDIYIFRIGDLDLAPFAGTVVTPDVIICFKIAEREASPFYILHNDPLFKGDKK